MVDFLILLIAWTVLGVILFGFTSSSGEPFSIWRLNPVQLYKRIKVNWFGVIWLTLLFNFMSPGLSFCYWFYKLCTVGRK